MQESENKSEVAQSCPTLSDPTDCSLPGSSVHGIFQARVLEWGAIAFSLLRLQTIKKWNQDMKAKLAWKQSPSVSSVLCASKIGPAIDRDHIVPFTVSGISSTGIWWNF